MAIDYNSGISSLQTGAPDIKYTGDQGPKSPDQQLMASADPMLVEEYNKYVFEMEEQGQTPISFREFVQQVMSGMAQGGRAGQAYGGTAHPTYTQSRKQRMAYGGIAGADGRRRYGIGSIYQKYIKDPIERYIRGPDVDQQVLDNESQMRVDREDQVVRMDPRTGREFDLSTYDPMTDPPLNDKNFPQISSGPAYENPIDTWFKGTPDPEDPEKREDSLTDRLGLTDGDNGKGGTIGNYLIPMAIGAAAGKTQADWLKKQPTLQADTSGINIADIRSRALTGSDPDLHFLPPASATTAYAQGGRIGAFNGGIQGLMPRRGRIGYERGRVVRPGGYAGETDYENWLIDNYDLLVTDLSWDDHIKYSQEYRDQKAQGGRIGAQEGGLMNLGGMEKDYRQEGGFVPLGGEERADDVPARLSKNEFVFTADAVRAAGGGDIDAGAEVMENVMNNLEQGGQVSEESQGLEGARNMFTTAQRLEGVM